MKSIDDLDRLQNASGRKPTSKIQNDMQRGMQSDAAVFRTQSSLEEGVSKINKVVDSFKDVGVTDRSMIWNTWVFLLSIEGLLFLALMIVSHPAIL